MRKFNGRYYAEVKNIRYLIHPDQKLVLGLREEPKPQILQYQVQYNTQIKSNRKVL